MPDDRRSWVVPDGPVTPEEVAHRGFATSFRGFDPNEVRNYLTRVSETLRAGRERQRELERQLREAESRAAHPVLDEATLTAALGEHTSRILASAHDAANEIRSRSQESIERVLREAHETSARIRGDAERLLADRTAEAEADAERIVELAEADAARLRTRVNEEATLLVDRAKEEGRALVTEAAALRARVLGDLARRRRVAHVQVEQLRAGRERLLEAYRVVQQTLEEVTDELGRAEVEARAAAQSAAQRVAAEPETAPAELEAALAASSEMARAAETAEAAESDIEAPPAEPETAEPDPAPPEPAAPEPATVASAVRSDRPLSGLRILRRGSAPARDEPVPAPPAELKVLHPPADIEAVRVIREPAPPAAEPPAPPPPPAPEPPPPEPRREHPVEDLFARIRAEAETTPEPQPQPAPEADARSEPEPARAETESAAEPPDAPPSEDERRLEQRDRALEPLEHQLARRLKRLLQDEQNEVLDRLRVHRGRPSLDVAFPEAPNGHDPYHRACADLLEQARKAGAAYAGSEHAADNDEDVGVGDLAERLAEEIRGPLRRRLGQALDEAASLDDDDLAVAERVGAAYRDWKFQRIERVVADHLGAAFARGAFLAWPKGTPLRWVVDQAEGRCPDCDDNALAGTTPRGEAYPTGQLHPPAHGGCRCVLVPSA